MSRERSGSRSRIRNRLKIEEADSHLDGDRRAQANLPVLVVALVLLVAATGIALAVATDARASAERDSIERSAAVSIADRLVAADGPTTRRRNVLDRTETAGLTIETVEETVPAATDQAIRLRLRSRSDDEGDTVQMLLERGDVRGGTTIRRIVSLAATTEESNRVHVPENGTSIAIPGNATGASVRTVSGNVTTVRADGRVVLHRPGGLEGTARVDLPRRARSRLAFEGLGILEVTIERESRSTAVLEVTVDERP
ncbi:hypothetical protein ACERIT_00235 [Halopenitus sp. H-Gu1]|uniref:DUF7263 family protein n=1 Tax=Halopenitus sp. H-Gu1 TaxID=3242697 RepID=UPI00359E978A